MVNVVCRTNIDTFRHVKWPTELAVCPRIGEDVQALEPALIRVKQQDTGQIKQVMIEQPTLRVVGVTHVGGIFDRYNGGPHVIIDLHHPHAKELGWLY